MRMTPPVLPPVPSYAIILTHNRPELLDRCVRAVHSQVTQLIVIDNASDPPASPPVLDEHANVVLVDPTQPPNLARLWNWGFEVAAELAAEAQTGQWNLIVLCDDAIVPPGWVSIVTIGMRVHHSVAACTGPVAAPLVKTAPDNDLMHRMPGHAFALAGEAGLRADERMLWWWCDTDLDWRARRAGGMVMLPGPVVANERPNEYTVGRPELAEQAGRDGETFREIWGWRPW
jgi:glycosyltransferase involved in cell wall biosynthesis